MSFLRPCLDTTQPAISIIESYPVDYPIPNVLLATLQPEPLHAVLALMPHFNNAVIEARGSIATLSSLSSWERVGVRVIECRFTSGWLNIIVDRSD